MRTVLTDGDQRDYTAAGTPRIATVHTHTRDAVRRHRRRHPMQVTQPVPAAGTCSRRCVMAVCAQQLAGCDGAPAVGTWALVLARRGGRRRARRGGAGATAADTRYGGGRRRGGRWLLETC
eukprot:COSAG03_NODE_2739_length_2488_cov_3.059439_3_plen_121_part_00